MLKDHNLYVWDANVILNETQLVYTHLLECYSYDLDGAIELMESTIRRYIKYHNERYQHVNPDFCVTVAEVKCKMRTSVLICPANNLDSLHWQLLQKLREKKK